MVLDEIRKIREKELKLVLDEVELNRDVKLLEIGCGNGFQTLILMEHLDSVIPTDVTQTRLRTRLKNFVKCSAENLPFRGQAFDVVYMSQVLEHIKRRNLALKETRRVLNVRSGILISVVPTSFWKILSVICYYFILLFLYVPRFIFGNYRQHISLQYIGSSVHHGECRNDQGRLSAYLLPKPHGEYQNNLEEYVAYRECSWIRLIESSGFEAFRTKHLFTHIPKFFILIPYFSSQDLGINCSFAIFSRVNRF